MMIPFIAWLFSLKPGGIIPIWPNEWPLLAQLALAVVFADFMFTVVHLLSHRYAALWKLHAVHHGAARIYGFNGLVRHPLHQAARHGPSAQPRWRFAGMPVEVATLLGFVISVQLIVQHSNVECRTRDHSVITCRSASIHHLHHVNWGKEGDVNFGLFFTLWDRVFGTFQPEPARPITAKDMGIDDVPQFPTSYLEHLAFPFRYTPGTNIRVRRGEGAGRQLDREARGLDPHDALSKAARNAKRAARSWRPFFI